MAFDYTQARVDAKEIISEFGLAGTFIKEGSGSGGYDDFGNPIPAEPDTIINGIVTPPLRFNQNEIDGEQILSSDSYVFFHSDQEPEIDSKITINGETYRNKKIWKLDSVGGVNVYRKIQLRK